MVLPGSLREEAAEALELAAYNVQAAITKLNAE